MHVQLQFKYELFHIYLTSVTLTLGRIFESFEKTIYS